MQVDSAGLEHVFQDGNHPVEKSLGNAGVLVDEQVLAQGVDGQARKSVGLAVHDAVRRDQLVLEKGAPMVACELETTFHLGFIEGLGLAEAQHADRNGTIGVEQAVADHVPLLVRHRDGRAKLEVGTRSSERVPEQPRVTTPQQSSHVHRYFDAT